MKIQQSIVSQAIYGDNGRVALPLDLFMKKSKDVKIGGKKKDISHLGVPLVIALVEIDRNIPLIHYNYGSTSTIPSPIAESFVQPDYKSLSCDNHRYPSTSSLDIDAIDEYRSTPTGFQPISNDIYNSLLNSVLEKPIEEISYYDKSSQDNTLYPTSVRQYSLEDSDIYSPRLSVKKHTRKNKK